MQEQPTGQQSAGPGQTSYPPFDLDKNEFLLRAADLTGQYGVDMAILVSTPTGKAIKYSSTGSAEDMVKKLQGMPGEQLTRDEIVHHAQTGSLPTPPSKGYVPSSDWRLEGRQGVWLQLQGPSNQHSCLPVLRPPGFLDASRYPVPPAQDAAYAALNQELDRLAEMASTAKRRRVNLEGGSAAQGIAAGAAGSQPDSGPHASQAPQPTAGTQPAQQEAYSGATSNPVGAVKEEPCIGTGPTVATASHGTNSGDPGTVTRADGAGPGASRFRTVTSLDAQGQQGSSGDVQQQQHRAPGQGVAGHHTDITAHEAGQVNGEGVSNLQGRGSQSQPAHHAPPQRQSSLAMGLDRMTSENFSALPSPSAFLTAGPHSLGGFRSSFNNSFDLFPGSAKAEDGQPKPADSLLGAAEAAAPGLPGGSMDLDATTPSSTAMAAGFIWSPGDHDRAGKHEAVGHVPDLTVTGIAIDKDSKLLTGSDHPAPGHDHTAHGSALEGKGSVEAGSTAVGHEQHQQGGAGADKVVDEGEAAQAGSGMAIDIPIDVM